MKLFAKTVRLKDAKFGYVLELIVYFARRNFKKIERKLN